MNIKLSVKQDLRVSVKLQVEKGLICSISVHQVGILLPKKKSKLQCLRLEFDKFSHTKDLLLQSMHSSRKIILSLFSHVREKAGPKTEVLLTDQSDGRGRWNKNQLFRTDTQLFVPKNLMWLQDQCPWPDAVFRRFVWAGSKKMTRDKNEKQEFATF